MHSLSIGNSTDEVSRLTVSGLPPLEIHVGKGGYLDGFVCHLKSLRKMYLTKNYEDIYMMALAISYEEHKPLGEYRKGHLAVLQLMKSWARVQLIDRVSPSKVTVYFVDTGVMQDVDINNLYEMPPKLKKSPPMAIPIIYTDNGQPEVDQVELQKLRGAKVAVKMDGTDPHQESFQVSEFTVFERNTHNNLEVVEALKNPKFDMTRAEGSRRLEAQMKAGAVSTSTFIITTTAAVAESGVNWAVLVVVVICVLAFISVIGVAVLYLIRKVKQKRRAEQQHQDQQKQQEAQSAFSSMGHTTRDAERNFEDEPPNMIEIPERESAVVLPLHADGLAVVTATIALANYEKDRERESTGATPHLMEELSVLPDTMSSRRISSGSLNNPRHPAGLSDISSIRADDTIPRPRCSTPCSTPLATSIFTPLRTPSARPSLPLDQRLLESSPLPEESELSNYSDILDVRQYIPRDSRETLDQTIADETIFVTAPSSQAE